MNLPLPTATTPTANGLERKSQLLQGSAEVLSAIKELESLLLCATPQARSLIVFQQIEKLTRSAERVRSSLQELVL